MDRQQNQTNRQETEMTKAVAKRKPAAVAAPEPVNPMTLMMKAVENPNFNVDAFEKLAQLQREEEDRQAHRAFTSAVAVFQSNVPAIVARREVKDRGGNVRYKFAAFEDIMKQIKPHLADCGLSVSFTTNISADGYINATCTVSHAMGHSESSEFTCPIDRNMSANESQKMGSANSYAKRYCIINALNLSVSDEDDDGVKGGGLVVDPDEAMNLSAMIDEVGADKEKFLAYYGIDSVESMPAEKYASAIRALEKKRKAS
jgi:hypothetical protein